MFQRNQIYLSPSYKSYNYGLSTANRWHVCFIPSAARPGLQIHAVQQQLQGLRGQPDFAVGLTGALRPVERSLLQTFCQYANTCPVKIQNFDPVVSAVPKDKERAALGVFSQVLLGSVPQAIEVHPQIARGGRDEHFELGVKT